MSRGKAASTKNMGLTPRLGTSGLNTGKPANTFSRAAQFPKQKKNTTYIMRGSITRLLRRSHTPEAVGSNPTPASNTTYIPNHIHGKELGCPECGSQRVWKDGLRSTWQGSVQRWICRDCGYRFSRSENSQLSKNVQKLQTEAMEPTGPEGSEWSEGLQKIHTKAVYRPLDKPILCRVGAAQTTGAKNLAEVETRTQEKAAGATATTQADIKGRIIEYGFYMLKNGYRESTISMRTRLMQTLAKRGANILDPESVKEVIAQQPWSESRKSIAVNTYTSFLPIINMTWKPPRYQPTRKFPFIPMEQEIDQLIASCGKKTATFLQTLKETAMRAGEADKLQWTDIDFINRVIRVTPEKNSEPRIFKVTEKLIGMLNALPKNSKRVFGDIIEKNRRVTFHASRKRAAEKLQNPRILQIHFHTLRHWKATLLYHQTKDILYVMRFLGHKNIKNTLLYIQLAEVMFKEASDQYTVRVAETVKEASELIEAGFEYVTEMDNVKLFRKRK